MKRMILLLAAVLLLTALFCGCEMGVKPGTQTNPPRITSNVTASPAPATAVPTAKPTEEPVTAAPDTPLPDTTVNPNGTVSPTESPLTRRNRQQPGLPNSSL